MNKKMLVILPTISEFTLKNDLKYPSGYFINELYIPAYHWEHAGITVDFATSNGKLPHCDQSSAVYLSKVKLNDAYAYFEQNEGMKSPLNLEKLTESDFTSYDGVFIPGSYALNEELLENPKFKSLLIYFHQNKKLIMLLSQSVYFLSLLTDTFEKEGKFPEITCFPKERELSVETINLKNSLAYYIETELHSLGFPISNMSSPLKPNVVIDHHIVTGQDYYSSGTLMRFLLKIVSRKKGL